jgi:D-xylose transport system substrate-binding protein
MRKGISVAVAAMLVSGMLAGCSDDDSENPEARPGKIGVILPDTTSSQRWVDDDPKYLKEAFAAAGVPADIQNAQGDKRRFERIGRQMIADGVTVLIIANLDSRSGKVVLDEARAENVLTIDYDRLTLNGGARYYVSFDNVAVGRMQAQGLIKCLAEENVTRPVVAELHGAPSDHNATLFKQGYDSVLQQQYDTGDMRKGPDQPVPNWDLTEAGLIFEQMMTQTDGKIDGVLAANDGLANAVIEVLKKTRSNGRVPVTGQDAEVQGLQNMLAGDQCMTVYKAIKAQATAAAELAIALAKGKPRDIVQVVKDPVSGADIQSVLLPPKLIYRADIKDVVREFAEACADAGVG